MDTQLNRNCGDAQKCGNLKRPYSNKSLEANVSSLIRIADKACALTQEFVTTNLSLNSTEQKGSAGVVQRPDCDGKFVFLLLKSDIRFWALPEIHFLLLPFAYFLC